MNSKWKKKKKKRVFSFPGITQSDYDLAANERAQSPILWEILTTNVSRSQKPMNQSQGYRNSTKRTRKLRKICKKMSTTYWLYDIEQLTPGLQLLYQWNGVCCSFPESVLERLESLFIMASDQDKGKETHSGYSSLYLEISQRFISSQLVWSAGQAANMWVNQSSSWCAAARPL